MPGVEGADGAVGGAGMYTVVKCGASGHNIRSQPSLKAPPVGMLVLGNIITADCDTKNIDGEGMARSGTLTHLLWLAQIWLSMVAW